MEPGTYKSWNQLSGYFDGDGNVGLEVVKRVIRFKIRFVDTWKPQVEAIASFLAHQGVSCGSIGRGEKRGAWQAAYRLDTDGIESVMKTAKSMLPFTVKKRIELQTVIAYLEGRITGNQALEVFNWAVVVGRRRGKIRFEDVLFTRGEGLRLSQLENARNARAAYPVNVSDKVQEEIRNDHKVGKLGHIRLSRKCGYSVSVIRRVLGER